MHALPVIRYPPGIISWPQEEMDATDVKTRKRLTLHGGFHPKSSTLRLCLAKLEGGGRGLCVTATIQDETRSIHEYIRKMAPQDKPLSEYLMRNKRDIMEDQAPPWDVPSADRGSG
ncbi:hypothetical protein LDENG_00119060 [Lucifuga dentata]|nr:hypothetical protein LDENG_00119060 [Lucifuga dentata]